MRKMFGKHGFGWFVVISLLVCCGCIRPMEPTFQGISKFQRNGKNTGKDQGFTLGIDIKNPNRYKIKVLSYDLEVFVSGAKVGEAHNRNKHVLPKNGLSTVDVTVVSDMKQIFGGILGALGGIFGKDKAVIVRLKGSVLAQVKGIRKQLPVELERSYSLNDL